MSEHTKTPWHIVEVEQDGGSPIAPTELCLSQYEDDAADAICWLGDHNREGNADFIVLACNSHDELVAALEELRCHFIGRRPNLAVISGQQLFNAIDQADALLSKVREKGGQNGNDSAKT